MAKKKLILFCVLIAALGVVLPVSLVSWLSWKSVLYHEHKRLETIAEQLLARKGDALAQARSVLNKLASMRDDPCSDSHVSGMQRLTLNNLAVDKIRYFEGDFLKCSSWGHEGRRIEQNLSDYVTQDGDHIVLRVKPAFDGEKPMMALHAGAYEVLISLGRLTDVNVRAGIHLAMARSGGDIIAESGSAEEGVSRIAESGQPPAEDANNFYASASRNGWTAVVYSRKGAILATQGEFLLWLIPVAAAICLAIVFLVVKLSQQHLSPKGELALGVKRKEFVVHYQPIVDIRSRRCIGAEALVRWMRPDGTMLGPDSFIPLAETSGLILPITDQVIAGVIKDLGPALAADRSLHISINLCAEDMKTGRALKVISEALQGSGIHPKQIWLEATERGFMDIASASATLTRARDQGHTTAMDDFGTGYSSLQHLQSLPIDALKIDKSFVDTIGRGEVSSSVIGHIIGMANSLDLFIVAEGIERPEQEAYLAERGVDFGQGWFYSKALSARDFIRFYRESSMAAGDYRLAGFGMAAGAAS